MNDYRIYIKSQYQGTFRSDSPTGALNRHAVGLGYKNWDHLCISVPKKPAPSEVRVDKVT